VAKILFVNPLVRAEDSPRHVPYGIAMLASIAMRAGHRVQVYDHNAWRPGDDVLKDVMQADDWDVVAAGGITTAYNSLKVIFQAAKAYAPKARTVLGGGVLTSMPHDIMRFLPTVDVGIIGEAYVTWPELLAAIDSKCVSYEDINGLIVRRNGDTYLTRPRGLLQDLDKLPYPAWELFPLEEVYFPNSAVALSEESLTATRRLDVNTSYGCSLICRFCFHLGISGDMSYVKGENGKTDVLFDMPGLHPRSIRYHSPRYVVDMVHYMVDRFKVNFVSFLDENLMTMDQYSKRTWMDAICDLWMAEGLQPECRHKGLAHDENCKTGVHWGGTSHATLCTERILKKMGDAGCSYLDYGWESFSPRILKTVGKGATPENNLRSYLWTMRAGIRPIPNQMVGFPSEDFDSIRASMKAWQELGIVCKPFFVTPYPGSEWYSVYKNKILEQYDGNLESFVSDLGDATDITATICENFSVVELYGLRELMIRGEFDKLDKFEAEWRKRNGDPQQGVDRASARMREKTPVTLVAAE
jgi:radical SAM superfamily enzyme YgiQ (UPF0313 family)